MPRLEFVPSQDGAHFQISGPTKGNGNAADRSLPANVGDVGSGGFLRSSRIERRPEPAAQENTREQSHVRRHLAPQPAEDHERGRADRRRQGRLPERRVRRRAGPETTKAVLGFIALTDASPLIIAKEKGFFAKHGMPDVEVSKQASWGTTRDNLVLGSDGSGIDGAHILTPMPYLISAGKVTQNNQPVPMHILARLNLDAQAISVAAAYTDLGVGARRRRAEGGVRAEEGRRQRRQGGHDLPRRHARSVDPLLARRRRHRSRQRRRDDRRCRRRRWWPT